MHSADGIEDTIENNGNDAIVCSCRVMINLMLQSVLKVNLPGNTKLNSPI